MSPTKDEIKTWLKNIGQDRQWLADQCLVSKKTVDNWISGGHKIPEIKLVWIQSLINKNNVDIPSEINIDVPDEFIPQLRKLAQKHNLSLSDVIVKILDEFVENKQH